MRLYGTTTTDYLGWVFAFSKKHRLILWREGGRNMRIRVGYGFFFIGFCVLIYTISMVVTFVNDPNTFNLYKLLSELPEMERTVSTGGRSLVLPVGAFKAFGIFVGLILLFVILSLVKLFFNIGVSLIAPKIDDIMEKMLNRLKGEALKNRLNI